MSTVATSPVLASAEVARERPVRFRGLGDFFLHLRAARGWNQSDPARFAAQKGIGGFTRQMWLRLERGQTKDPDPGVLRSVAQLYELPYEELIRRVVSAKYGVDLTPERIAAVLDEQLALEEYRARDDERPLLDRWRASSPKGRELALIVLEYLGEDQQASGTGRRGKSR